MHAIDMSTSALLAGYLVVTAIWMWALKWSAAAPPEIFDQTAMLLTMLVGVAAFVSRSTAVAVGSAAANGVLTAIRMFWVGGRNLNINMTSSAWILGVGAAVAAAGRFVATATLSALRAKELLTGALGIGAAMGALSLSSMPTLKFQMAVPILISLSVVFTALAIIYQVVAMRLQPATTWNKNADLQSAMAGWERALMVVAGGIAAVGVAGTIILYGASFLTGLVGDRTRSLFFYIILAIAGWTLLHRLPVIGVMAMGGAAVGVAWMIGSRLYNMHRDYYRGKKVVGSNPLSIEGASDMATYTELNGSEAPTYAYSISLWLFLNSFPPSVGVGYTRPTTVLKYGDVLELKYNATNAEMSVYIKDKERIRYPNVLLQRWNNVVLTCDDGKLDMFVNGDLVRSIDRAIPFVRLDTLQIGSTEGIHGQIANVSYYRTPLQLPMVQYISSYHQPTP
jgi:hypothetical protein